MCRPMGSEVGRAWRSSQKPGSTVITDAADGDGGVGGLSCEEKIGNRHLGEWESRHSENIPHNCQAPLGGHVWLVII